MWSLILSDVVNNSVDYIASGPTIYNDELEYITDAESIIEKYEAASLMPIAFHEAIIDAKVNAKQTKAPVEDHVANMIIGSNAQCVEEALSQIRRSGYFAVPMSCQLQGRTIELSRFFHRLSKYISTFMLFHKLPGGHERGELVSQALGSGMSGEKAGQFMANVDAALIQVLVNDAVGICVVGSGETTTTLCSEPGEGGRNQEMVLAFAKMLVDDVVDEHLEIGFLSCGTDGQDGPTPATGAVISSEDLNPGSGKFDVADATDSLKRNDSHGFFKRRGKGLVTIGATGTNVMDVQMLSVQLRK